MGITDSHQAANMENRPREQERLHRISLIEKCYIVLWMSYTSIYKRLERRRGDKLNKMMLSAGIVLIIIAIILGAVRYSSMYDFGVKYGAGNGYYFYALVAIIGVIGIILMAWAYMKNEGKPEKPAAAPAT
jgi:hypothetical protein